jgi:predicted TIM-barrel fold metal-dependent hydrolase
MFGGRVYKGYKIIDSDSHVMEPDDLWERYIDKRYREYAGKAVTIAGDPPRFHVDINVGGHQWGSSLWLAPDPKHVKGENGELLTYSEAYGEFIAEGFSAKAYLNYLDWRGIDYVVLYPTAGLFVTAARGIDPKVAAAVRRAYNDWLYDFCAEGDGKLLGVGSLDLRDVDLAIQEAERCVTELGMHAVYILPDTPMEGVALNSAYYDPLWAAIADLGVPLALHEITPHEFNVPGIAQITGSQISFARETCAFVLGAQVSALLVCAGGICERHPDLRVVFNESSAGWVPGWMWYLDEQWEQERPGAVDSLSSGARRTAEKPSAYFKRQCYVAAEAEEPGIKYVIDYQGDHNILYNTDFPHPNEARVSNPADDFLALEGISEQSRRRILWDNAAALYGIE